MQTKNWLSAVRQIFLQHDSLEDKKTHFAFVIKHLQLIKPVFMKYEYDFDVGSLSLFGLILICE